MEVKVNIATYNFSTKGFWYNNDGYDAFYIHRFPIVKHNRVTTLEGVFTISAETGEGVVDVYDMNHNVYAPFYHISSGNYDTILELIYTQINKELKRLGIKKNDKRAVRNTKKR
ncbi:MAG: hypothetical protein PUC73_12565 [Lachnospiraceae bacterium]|nr:hypothetical protein [Lachnospiraceae bacterium]